jgi:hypothetical protein
MEASIDLKVIEMKRKTISTKFNNLGTMSPPASKTLAAR